MAYVTVYRMQAYRRAGGRLIRHEVCDYGSPEEAARHGHALALRRAGVGIFSVEVDPATGQVGRVRMLSGFNTREVARLEASSLGSIP